MSNINLKIYDESGKNVVKIYEAETYELPFGTVRKLMNIVKIEDMNNQAELLKTIAGAWDEILNVLHRVFPACTDDEWDAIKAKEVLKVIIQIAQSAISDIFIIPTEKN